MMSLLDYGREVAVYVQASRLKTVTPFPKVTVTNSRSPEARWFSLEIQLKFSLFHSALKKLCIILLAMVACLLVIIIHVYLREPNKKVLLSGTPIHTFSSAFVQLRQKAESGDVYSQLVLCEKYREKFAPPKTDNEAIAWQIAAVDLIGNAQSHFCLGLEYSTGKSLKQDFKEATERYLMAALEGHSEAQLRLAINLDDGVGTSKNVNEASYWYKKAADQGNSLAKTFLGTRKIISGVQNTSGPKMKILGTNVEELAHGASNEQLYELEHASTWLEKKKDENLPLARSVFQKCAADGKDISVTLNCMYDILGD